MKWISIKDKKPRNGDHIIIYGKDLYSPIITHYYTDKSAMQNFFLMQLIGSWDFITHWMPLPKPPNSD